MTDAPTRSTTADIFEFGGELPWLSEDLAAALGELDQQLHVALSGSTTNTEEADRILWESLRIWGRGRVAQDFDLPLLERGLWSLTDRESVRINTGLVHGALLGERTTAALIQEFQRELTSSTRADVSCLTRALSGAYRDRLQIDALLECNSLIAGLDREASANRSGIASVGSELESLIQDQPEAERLLPMHAQLMSVLVPLARMTRVHQSGGVTADDRRKDMKVREVAQKLRMVIHDALTFRVRKDYDSHEKALMRLHLRSLEIGEELVVAQDAMAVRYSRQDLEQAVTGAIDEFQGLMARVSGCLDDELPSYALVHQPRVFPQIIDEYWQEIRDKCPRLAAVRGGAGPSIVLLPGTGNAIHDIHSGRVLVTIFPLEVRLTSLEGALAESAFLANPELVESFAKVTRIPTRERGRLGEEFRRHIRDFLAGTQDASKPGVPRWMQNQLFRRA